MSARRQVRADASHEADESIDAYAGRLRVCIDYLANDARASGFVVTATVLDTALRFVDSDLAALRGK